MDARPPRPAPAQKRRQAWTAALVVLAVAAVLAAVLTRRGDDGDKDVVIGPGSSTTADGSGASTTSTAGDSGEGSSDGSADRTTGRGSSSGRGGGGSGDEDATSSSAGAGGSGQGSTAPGATGANPAHALGTYRSTGASAGCLAGASSCEAFEISCPGLGEAATGEIDVRSATGSPRGVVVFFSHARGGSWWLESMRDDSFETALRAAGLAMVQVRWTRTSWLEVAPGEDAGTSAVACRPATAIRHVYDTVYAGLGVDADPLHCGFCITGVSGGASQVAYSLAYYGLDSILDAVVPVSGPPHGDLLKGCLRRPGEEGFWYKEPEHIANIDMSFGVLSSTDGPCARHDEEWVDRWAAESVATGAPDYHHPATRVHFLIGGRDESPAPSHAQAYADALQRDGSTPVTVEVDPTMPHGLNQSGLERLLNALLA